MNKESLIKKSIEIHGDKYDFSLVSNNFTTKEKLPIICPLHGTFYKSSEKLIGSKQGCPECSGKKRLDTKSFIEKAKKLEHCKNYDFSKVDYKNNKTHVVIICPEHGEFKISPNHLLSGEGCPKCRYIKSASSKRRSVDDIIKLSIDVHGDKYDYSMVSEYKNDRIKYPIICKEHGVFYQTFNNHIKGKQGCPKCGRNKTIECHFLTRGEWIKRAHEVHNKKYDYSMVEYTHSANKVIIKCPTHGEFQQIARNHLSGAGCPNCFKEKSNIEKELLEFIKELLPNYNIIENDRKILSGQEIDVYIPELKIGFEMNGLLWHSEKYNEDKNYHLNKTINCNNQGVKLYQIFEDEWLWKNEICKSRIRNILKFTKNIIYARKCNIKEIDSKTQRLFLNENHIQGYINSKIAYGLYFENELVSIMTFGNKRIALGSKHKENTYELLRFCSKQNYNVIGAAGKLFKYFINKMKPLEVISYADRRWSFGNLYEKIGFTMLTETKPNYFYVLDKHRKNRFCFRKDILVSKHNCPKEVTEHEFCYKQGWYRIYDCGALKYVWKKEN